MYAQEFLQHVRPATGWLTVVAIDNRTDATKQWFYTDIQEALSKINELNDLDVDVYYTPNSFKSKERKTANVQSARSLYLDIDCGDSKPYQTTADALIALRDFCKAVGLPRPTLVSSGNGLHAYWTLEEEVEPSEWSILSARLEATCRNKGLHIDAAVTKDAARILRVPGTKNFKDRQNPKAVTLMGMGARCALPVIDSALLPALNVSPLRSGRPQADETTRNLAGYKEAVFRDLLEKSLQGKGCNQISAAYTDQASVPEPLWWAVLSIGQFCVDRDKAIHKISQKHPKYNPEETESKASRSIGPRTCAEFEVLNAEKCKGCAFKGTIASPIALGTRPKEAATAIPAVIADRHKHQEDLPAPPEPYFYGEDGAVYLRQRLQAEDGTWDNVTIKVYDYPLFITGRTFDREEGETYVFKVLLPMDGARTVNILGAELGSKDRLKAKLGTLGIHAIPDKRDTRTDLLMSYVTRFVIDYQSRAAAMEFQEYVGWNESGNPTSFSMGSRLVLADHEVARHPHPKLLALASAMKPTGNLESWLRIVQHYNKVGLERRAILFLLSGFAAPLFRFAPFQGGTVHAFSRESGVGKTTVVLAGQSVFARPRAMMINQKDTDASKVWTMAQLRDLASLQDEVTGMHPDAMCNMLFVNHEGVDKRRMSRGGDRLRAAPDVFYPCQLTTGNNSIEAAVASYKQDAQGELARLMEIPLEMDYSLNDLQAKQLFSGLNHHYGVAATPYIQHCLQNLSRIRKMIEEQDAAFTALPNLGMASRFRINTMATAYVSGVMANEAVGLGFDMDRIKGEMVHLLQLCHTKQEANSTTGKEMLVLGAYINQSLGKALIIDTSKTSGSVATLDRFIDGPRYGELAVRLETDTKIAQISVADLKKWCAVNGMAYQSMIDSLKEQGVYKGARSLRLGKGWKDMPPVWAAIFDLSNADILAGVNTDAEEHKSA